jgi:dTMP kinase
MLIAIDGVYSVGKSTLIQRVAAQLRATTDRPVAVTEWNSSDLVGDLIPAWKRDGRLGPHSLLFAEATDFAHRCERVIEPHLSAGGIVVADRYVLSGIARGVIRGVDPSLATRAFDFGPPETLMILVECPPELTLRRRTALGKQIGGYHSGRDFRRTGDVEADFVWYQREMMTLYRELAAERGDYLVVDTDRDVEAGVAAVLRAVTATQR